MAELVRPAAIGLLIGAAYFVAAEVGIALTMQPTPVSTLWPPNAVVMAILLLTPPRLWWGVLLAALPAHLAVELRAEIPLPMAMSWFVSNSFDALIGAGLIRWLSPGPVRFDSFRRYSILVLATFVAVALSSFLDAWFVQLNAFGSVGYWDNWRMRFFSNILATLTLVPLIVGLGTGAMADARPLPTRRLLEGVLLAAILLGVCYSVFSRPVGPNTVPALLYAPLPLLLWAAVRFGPATTSGFLLGVSLLAIDGAIRGDGPFVASTPGENAFSMQLFLIVIAVPLTALSAVTRERLHAQDEARRSQKRLQLALDAAQMGTWEWQIATDQSHWSEKSKEIFGVDGMHPELTLDHFLQLVRPEDRDEVAAAMQRTVREGTPFESEFRITLPGGQSRWVLAKGVALFDPAGRPTRLIGVNADVTERVRAERALRSSEERLAKTFRSSPDAIAITRREDDRILEVNGTWEELFGYRRDDAVGRTPVELGLWETTDRERFRQLLAAGHPVRDFEVELRTRTGGVRPVVLGADTDEMGGEPCVITYTRDLTEQKRAEAEAREQRLEVAHLSRVAMLGELSGALAHELNQPLTAILANARAAQRLLRVASPDLDELRSILADIAEDDRRAGEVIERLRAFLRKGDIQPGRLDLNQVVTEVLGLVHSDLIQRGVTVDARLSPLLPAVFADRVQLQQVLLNLLLNACDAMADDARGEKRVTIVTAESGTDQVVLSVADQGTGIAPDEMDRVFEPFVTSKPHGLGLGLAICRSIVTAHGGRLWADNNAEGGATFHLMLAADPVSGEHAAMSG